MTGSDHAPYGGQPCAIETFVEFCLEIQLIVKNIRV